MARGSNGWDIGKLPMLMIPPVRQNVNGSFCRILPPFVNSRRAPYILSICTRMLNSYIVHLKFSFICAMIQKRKQKSPSPSLSFLTNERSQHYEIHLHLQKSLPERFRQGLCREKGRQAREVFQGGARGFCHLLRREEEPLCRRDHAPRRQRHAVPRGM